jgi:VCBS repeat-containing protein
MVSIVGDVTGNPPNVSNGDLDAVPAFGGLTIVSTAWTISSNGSIGTATINASGDWQYVVDSAEFANLDDGEVVFDTFTVSLTATLSTSGGFVFNSSDTQEVTIQIEGVCFVLGTLIETVMGPVPVENLTIGELVKTADHGPQPIRWLEGNEVKPSRMKKIPVFSRFGSKRGRWDRICLVAICTCPNSTEFWSQDLLCNCILQ